MLLTVDLRYVFPCFNFSSYLLTFTFLSVKQESAPPAFSRTPFSLTPQCFLLLSTAPLKPLSFSLSLSFFLSEKVLQLVPIFPTYLTFGSGLPHCPTGIFRCCPVCVLGVCVCERESAPADVPCVYLCVNPKFTVKFKGSALSAVQADSGRNLLLIISSH